MEDYSWRTTHYHGLCGWTQSCSTVHSLVVQFIVGGTMVEPLRAPFYEAPAGSSNSSKTAVSVGKVWHLLECDELVTALRCCGVALQIL